MRIPLDRDGVFAPGSFFFHGERPQPYLRLNFVMNSEEVIEEGIRRLGRVVERLLVREGSKIIRTPQRRAIRI
jgi:DNA-binding transcriptional MocR family regulator